MTIVVVDDEERVRLATTAMLEGLGCTVRTAQDTTTALTATADDTLDLALVDWTLAGETGLDVIDRVASAASVAANHSHHRRDVICPPQRRPGLRHPAGAQAGRYRQAETANRRSLRIAASAV